MTARIHFVRCLDEQCEWRGSRRTDVPAPCPQCGGEVELYERRSNMTERNSPTPGELGIVRPAPARTPFGIPNGKPAMRPWHDGTVRELPNGLRAKVVRIPSLADALDHANLRSSESVHEVLNFTGWNKDR